MAFCRFFGGEIYQSHFEHEKHLSFFDQKIGRDQAPWMSGMPPSGKRKLKALSISWLTSGRRHQKQFLNSLNGLRRGFQKIHS